MARSRLPEHGKPWTEVKATMEAAKAGDSPWYSERAFRGGSYFAGEDVTAVANQAYQLYINTNALFANLAFSSLARYEADLVAMLLEMMNAPEGAIGSLTVGGTESILMAVKTARDWARDAHPQAGAPEVIVPRAAHPGFDKSAHLMGFSAVRVLNSVDFGADVEAMRTAITPNTFMLVASAPSYPFGVTDPVAEIAALAAEHGLWLHVDACHGGFIFPFAKKLGYAFPDYDFAVPGVTSISVDVHKLGYSNKGVSALMFREAALEAYQRYTFDTWPSGVYSTANLTGSRSGGGLASAWAVAHYLGEAGYLRIVGKILKARDALVAGIGAIPELSVWGEPHAYLIAYGSEEIDIFAVDDGMTERGWLTMRGLEPDSVHLFVDASHEPPVVQRYLADLAKVVAQVKAGKIKARGEGAVYAT